MMMFTDLAFWVILIPVLLLLMLFKNSPRGRNIYLVIVGLVFYFESEGLLLSILLAVTTADFFIAKGIAAARATPVRKLLLGLAIMLDVSLLCYFKYAPMLPGRIGSLPLAGIAPLGISYYIFKSIGYNVDVFRRKVKPVGNILDYALYMTFFPSIISGPILRADQFIPQIYKPWKLSREEFGSAVVMIMAGLMKKVILGDYIAVNFVDRVFDNARLFSGFENLCACFGYSLELYADFSGYTDMAIGVALLLGFKIPLNFNSPYKATDARDFWKRWHISLSSWLQEYLYFPLGGNRHVSLMSYVILAASVFVLTRICGNLYPVYVAAGAVVLLSVYYLTVKSRRKYIRGGINTITTMLLGGLWHGASYCFVLWGAINGTGIVASRTWNSSGAFARILLSAVPLAASIALRHFFAAPALNIALVWSALLFGGTLFWTAVTAISSNHTILALRRAWSILMTFIFVTFAWIFFRSNSLEDTLMMLHQIGDPSQWDITVVVSVVKSYWKVFALMAAGMLFHWLPDDSKDQLRAGVAGLPLFALVILAVAVVLLCYQFAGTAPHPFIYFQF